MGCFLARKLLLDYHAGFIQWDGGGHMMLNHGIFLSSDEEASPMQFDPSSVLLMM